MSEPHCVKIPTYVQPLVLKLRLSHCGTLFLQMQCLPFLFDQNLLSYSHYLCDAVYIFLILQVHVFTVVCITGTCTCMYMYLPQFACTLIGINKQYLAIVADEHDAVSRVDRRGTEITLLDSHLRSSITCGSVTH